MDSSDRLAGTSSPIRPGIQAIRALAVLLVVVYHLWPEGVTGGYIGVDVFFVVSGFLMTAQLMREAERDGRIRVGAFWARRARRLLPASLLVALLTAVAVVAVVPQTEWGQFFKEIAAATLYVVNWVLAADAVDYLAAGQGASPVQHYWSLSVEEQFYIALPLLVLVAVLVARRVPASARRVLLVVLAGAAVASLVVSIVQTAAEPGIAYFSTLTRAWEFGAGGLLALVERRLPVPGPRLSGALSWLAIAAILAAGLGYDGSTPFPGTAAALPVVATAVLIHVATASSGWGIGPLVRFAPVRYVGDISYALYLWHWPLIALFPYAFILHDVSRWVSTPVVLLLAVVLAAVTTRWVEQPIRSGRLLPRDSPSGRVLALAAAGMAVVVGATAVPWALVERRVADEAAELAAAGFDRPACFGAASRLDPACAGAEPPTGVWPSALVANREARLPCRTDDPEVAGPVLCVSGPEPADAAALVALVGDSHALQARGMLAELIEERGWRVYSFALSGCTASLVLVMRNRTDQAQCQEHNEAAVAWLASRPDIDLLVVATLAPDLGGSERYSTAVEGFAEYWEAASVEKVAVIRDNPVTRQDVRSCVEFAAARGIDAGPACARPRSEPGVVIPDPAAEAAERLGHPVLDFTDAYCDAERCFPVVGGAMVYRDWTHVTVSWQRSLAPFVAQGLAPLVGE